MELKLKLKVAVVAAATTGPQFNQPKHTHAFVQFNQTTKLAGQRTLGDRNAARVST